MFQVWGAYIWRSLYIEGLIFEFYGILHLDLLRVLVVSMLAYTTTDKLNQRGSIVKLYVTCCFFCRQTFTLEKRNV